MRPITTAAAADSLISEFTSPARALLHGNSGPLLVVRDYRPLLREGQTGGRVRTCRPGGRSGWPRLPAPYPLGAGPFWEGRRPSHRCPSPPTKLPARQESETLAVHAHRVSSSASFSTLLRSASRPARNPVRDPTEARFTGVPQLSKPRQVFGTPLVTSPPAAGGAHRTARPRTLQQPGSFPSQTWRSAMRLRHPPSASPAAGICRTPP
jgi:hypothetical protein